MEKVSIIVPVYNVQDYLDRCLKSILNQTYSILEIILVDDGSMDETGHICDRYSEENEHITVIHKKNGGVSSARNAGIERARGKYLVFIDGDDCVKPTFIEELHNEFSKNEIQLSICSVSINNKYTGNKECGVLTREETLLGLYSPKSFLGYSVNKMFLRSIVEEFSLRFLEDLAMCEDSLFCTQYVYCIEAASFINRDLYIYEIRGNSASQKYNEDRFTVLEGYKKIIDINAGQIPMIKKQLQINYVTHSVALFEMMLRNRKISQNRAKEVYKIMREGGNIIWDNKMPVKLKLRLCMARWFLRIYTRKG